ncbi:HDIG domain-containing protein [Patescibacteria group bacterium]|nr:HDIG domain-containing protein [Patescibacteria group bacterium]
MQPTRQQALDLAFEWVKSESLRKHLLAVEAAMRAYATKYGEDPEIWGITGLLHDFDYEKFPSEQQHPFEGVKKLRELEYPEEITQAILGHALYSGVPRASNMAKALFACDELCGFVVACAYVRPDKLQGLEAPSVIKKLKTKTFAEKVSRSDIDLGIKELGVDKSEHINFIIQALQGISRELGF